MRVAFVSFPDQRKPESKGEGSKTSICSAIRNGDVAQRSQCGKKRLYRIGDEPVSQ
jgi:hypothetical protein